MVLNVIKNSSRHRLTYDSAIHQPGASISKRLRIKDGDEIRDFGFTTNPEYVEDELSAKVRIVSTNADIGKKAGGGSYTTSGEVDQGVSYYSNSYTSIGAHTLSSSEESDSLHTVSYSTVADVTSNSISSSTLYKTAYNVTASTYTSANWTWSTQYYGKNATAQDYIKGSGTEWALYKGNTSKFYNTRYFITGGGTTHVFSSVTSSGTNNFSMLSGTTYTVTTAITGSGAYRTIINRTSTIGLNRSTETWEQAFLNAGNYSVYTSLSSYKTGSKTAASCKSWMTSVTLGTRTKASYIGETSYSSRSIRVSGSVIRSTVSLSSSQSSSTSTRSGYHSVSTYTFIASRANRTVNASYTVYTSTAGAAGNFYRYFSTIYSAIDDIRYNNQYTSNAGTLTNYTTAVTANTFLRSSASYASGGIQEDFL